MSCSICRREVEVIEGRCHSCAANAVATMTTQLSVLQTRYERLLGQVKDLADTIDQGLNVSNEGKGPMERLSSQVAALLQCYIEERLKRI